MNSGEELRDVVADAWEALRTVFDPELAIDIVALGLVYDIREIGDGVQIDITLTTPGCPVSETIPEDARDAVSRALGAGHPVDVQVVWEPVWTPDRMDPNAAEALGFAR